MAQYTRYDATTGKTYTDPYGTSSWLTRPQDLQAGINAQNQMRSDYGRNVPVGISNLQSGFMGNGNIQAQGGTAQVNANGVRYNVPNYLLQQMMATDAYNQGRSNQLGEFFGVSDTFGKPVQMPAGMQYANYDASQQRLNNFVANDPRSQINGSLNPFVKAQEQQRGARATYESLLRDTTPMTETRGINGQVTGGDVQARQARIAQAKQAADAADQQMRSFETRGSRIRAEEESRPDYNGLFNQLKVRPTYSNLPISERIV